MKNHLVIKLSTLLCIITFMPEDAFATGGNSSKFRSVAGRESSEVNTILNGRGIPKSALGLNGDFYIDINTFTIYGPKRNGKWSVGTSLKGPQGIEGKSGEKGVTGGNVARLLFWPSIIGTYMNANEAIAAAENRKVHLVNVMMNKKCPVPNLPTADTK